MGTKPREKAIARETNPNNDEWKRYLRITRAHNSVYIPRQLRIIHIMLNARFETSMFYAPLVFGSSLENPDDALVKQTAACERLTRIEGIGPIGSVLLYATLGTGEAFTNGCQFSAYLGLTPKQYSSGGKKTLIGISRYVANKRLRAVLIQGARAYIHRSKEPKTPKQRWLWDLIQRAGYGRATVALANKNARTASSKCAQQAIRHPCITNSLPCWQLDPKKHLSRCPILAGHF